MIKHLSRFKHEEGESEVVFVNIMKLDKSPQAGLNRTAAICQTIMQVTSKKWLVLMLVDPPKWKHETRQYANKIVGTKGDVDMLEK